VLHGCWTGDVTAEQEYTLGFLEEDLRRIFGLLKAEVTGGRKNCITSTFVICIFVQEL